jgi:hypothetical protein
MFLRRLMLTSICLTTFSFASGIEAYSQDVVSYEEQTVRERSRPEYDPLGIGVGPWMVYSSILAGVAYDSNVFKTPNPTDDFVFLLAPEINAQSQFSRHKLDFKFNVNNYTYADNSSENRTDVLGRLDGRIDILSDLAVNFELGGAYLHEDRGSSNTPGAAADPVAYSLFDANADIVKTFNRLRITTGASVERYNYHDVDAIGGGKIDQDFRDGLIYQIIGDAAFQFSPGYAVFATVEGNWRDFDSVGVNNRDSQGYRVYGGLEMELTRLVSGRFGAGVLGQNYDNALFTDIHGYTYKANITWTPTALMTVTLQGDRVVSETSLAGVSGRIDSTLELIVDYEVLRNVILSPSVGFALEEFEGSPREDKTYSAGVKVDYLVNRYLAVGASYDFATKDSNVAGVDYDRHVVAATIRAQF